MRITFADQTLTLALGFAMGVALCLLYDIFRILRLCKTPSKSSAFLQDMLFWIVSAFLTFGLMMVRASGEVRLFILAAQALGFAICRVSVSPILMRISERIIKFAKRIIRFTEKKFIRPIGQIMQDIIAVWLPIPQFLMKNVINICENVKKGLKHRRFSLYNNVNEKSAEFADNDFT